MLKQLLSTTAVVAVLAAAPAMAAEQKSADKQQVQSQQQTEQKTQSQDGQNTESNKSAQSPASQGSGGSLEFVSNQSESDWLGSTLIGRSVQNPQGDNLGDINNIVVNENGEVVAVVIGVGGFLGIGEKDVGVQFSSLEFKEDDRMDAARKQAERLRDQQQTGAAQSGAQSANKQLTEDEQRMAQKAEQTNKSAQGNQSQTAQQSGNSTAAQNETRATAQRKDSSHSDMIIVLNTTREQLESAPKFAYLGERAEPTQNQGSESETKNKNQ